MSKGGGHRGGDGAALTTALLAVLRAPNSEGQIRELWGLLKAEQAAEFLAIDLSTLRHLTCRGELPVIRTGKRGVAYRMLDLVEWSEARRSPARS